MPSQIFTEQAKGVLAATQASNTPENTSQGAGYQPVYDPPAPEDTTQNAALPPTFDPSNNVRLPVGEFKAPAPTYDFVPGLGMMGPDIGGYAKGVMLAQETLSKQNQQNIMNLGVNEAQFDRTRQQIITTGIMDNAQKGGYPAVIDYLRVADPDRAMQFENAKIQLDNNILGNKVLQATSQDQIATAMAHSYSLLGKMGYQIMNAPEDQQQALYSAAMPLVKQVNPNAPDNVQDAFPMFMLAGAQSMPAAYAYMGAAAGLQATTDMGKAQAYIAQLHGMGYADNSPEMQNALLDLNKYKNQAIQAGMAVTQAGLNQVKTQNEINQNKTQQAQFITGLNNNIVTQLNTYSDRLGYSTFMKQYPTYLAAKARLLQDPNDYQAQYILSTTSKAMLGMSDSRNPADSDALAFASSDTSFNSGLQYIRELASGTKIAVDPSEQPNVFKLIDAVGEKKYKTMLDVESQQKKLITNTRLNDGSALPVDWDNIPLPSQQYDKANSDFITEQSTNKAFSTLPPAVQQYGMVAMDAARKAGKDPIVVQQKVIQGYHGGYFNELLQQQQSQAPAGGAQ